MSKNHPKYPRTHALYVDRDYFYALLIASEHHEWFECKQSRHKRLNFEKTCADIGVRLFIAAHTKPISFAPVICLKCEQ